MFFSSFGTVADCKIIVDKNSNKSKGYRFVTFEDPETAEKVKKSKDLNFMGKTMNASDAYRKNDGLKKTANNIAGNNYDHPGYQSPPYSVPYAIPIPYYVPSYNPISYVPYVYPYYGGGWSPSGGGSSDYYLYQPYEYDDAYDEDDNGGDNGEGEIEGGKGSKEVTSNGDEESDGITSNNSDTNTAESQSSTDIIKVCDTIGGTSDNNEKSICVENGNSNHSNNQEVDG